MRALVIDSHGGPEALRLADIPAPTPGPGQALVQVAYAGLNPADWKTCEGHLARYITYQFPFVPGFDLAGVVVAVGPGVHNLAPGARVFGSSTQGQGGNGSYAEFTLAYEAMLARAPENITLADAAGLTTAGTTAYGSIIDVGGLKAGQSVLINGGAGGVGTLGIQIARNAGARVAVTCSPRNADYVKSLGAELAIDYRDGRVVDHARAWAPDGVDLVVDAVGLDSLVADATKIVRPGGAYVEIQTLFEESSDALKSEAARAGVRIESNMAAIARLPEHLERLADLVAKGEVTPPPTEIMPLEAAGEALARIKAGHVRGKIVLQVADLH